MASSLVQQRGMDNQTPQLLLTEATAMVGYLLHYEVETASITDRELIKRLYWLCFAGQWSVFVLPLAMQLLVTMSNPITE
jgi:hypothetical protein